MKILISYPTNLYHCEYNDCSLATPIPFSSCTNKKEARRLTNKLDQPTLFKKNEKGYFKKMVSEQSEIPNDIAKIIDDNFNEMM